MNTYEHNLKLLAVRPLEGCDSKFTRTLQAGTLYPLLQNYEFKMDNSGNVFEIKADNSSENLYNQSFTQGNNLTINVSAIVGENGSGKSSLMELFYISTYLVGVQNNLISIDQFDRHQKSIAQEILHIYEGLKVEVFYEMDQQFYCLRIDGENLNIYESEYIKVIDVLTSVEIDPSALFFSIVINYSIYGLNSESSGKWIWKIYNKNDGYRTPIVINPYREYGTIDVLSEAHLAQSRLLANIKTNSRGDLGIILSNKKIEKVNFVLKAERLKRLEGIEMFEVIRLLENRLESSQNEIFEKIYQAILNTKDVPAVPQQIAFGKYLQIYIIKKCIKIAKNYREYRDKFFEEEPGKRRAEKIPTLYNFGQYLKALKRDRSHVTLKLRQALNAYRFNMFSSDPDAKIVKHSARVEFPIRALLDRVTEAHSNFPSQDLIEFIPIAMFMPNIIFSDGSNFMTLSSGEQQFIHSMQAVIYHLNNLNSVYQVLADNADFPVDKIKYQHVNVILDEIELYFHPEYQRRYLYELLFNLRTLDLLHIKAINIIFLTHSPFILSDIPASNILKLKEGKIVPQTNKTFAGNIHTMLSDSFFMKSTIGELARNEYAKIIDFYNKVREAEEEEEQFTALQAEYYEKKEIFSYIVDIIGEDVLRRVLKNNIGYIEKKLGLLDESTYIQKLLADRRRIDEDLKKLGYDKN